MIEYFYSTDLPNFIEKYFTLEFFYDHHFILLISELVEALTINDKFSNFIIQKKLQNPIFISLKDLESLKINLIFYVYYLLSF